MRVISAECEKPVPQRQPINGLKPGGLGILGERHRVSGEEFSGRSSYSLSSPAESVVQAHIPSQKVWKEGLQWPKCYRCLLEQASYTITGESSKQLNLRQGAPGQTHAPDEHTLRTTSGSSPANRSRSDREPEDEQLFNGRAPNGLGRGECLDIVIGAPTTKRAPSSFMAISQDSGKRRP